MKRTVLAMMMVGSSVAMFAQTTPTTPTNPTTPTTPTTSPTTTQPTTQPTTTSPATDPTATTTPNSNMNNQTTVNTSTSWAPGTSPYWGWNSYGIWNNAGNTTANGAAMNNATANTNMNNADMNANASASMNSSNSYSAYAGTAVAALPRNVQMNFGKDFPTTANNQYSWNQYGDWFHTQYTANGRLTQYFYDQRGNGYSLSLPVIQTYVPEDIIDKALQKHGARLYSVSMVKTAEGKDAYQLGLLERGQMRMEYLNEDGSSVANVWRVEEMNMNSTSTNAAMDNTTTPATDASVTTDANAATSSEMQTDKQKEVKKVWKENGVKTKIKADEGKVKIKQKKIDD